MTPQQIKAFIDAMAASDLQEMEVGHDGWTLRLSRQQRAVVAAPVPRAAEQAASVVTPLPLAEDTPAPEVLAPMFGVVHLQSAPGAAPFVAVGDVVRAGQPLCTIEAMKVFNEVRAEQAGRVTAVLVSTGVEVEAGQALFRIEGADV